MSIHIVAWCLLLLLSCYIPAQPLYADISMPAYSPPEPQLQDYLFMARSRNDNNWIASGIKDYENGHNAVCYYLQTVNAILGATSKAHLYLGGARLERSILDLQSEAKVDHATRPSLLFKENSPSFFNDDRTSSHYHLLRLAFAANSNWEPLLFLDKDGYPGGLVGEYLRRFQLAGGELQIRSVGIDDWEAIYKEVEGGNLDALITTADTVPWLSGDWVSSKTFLTVPSVIVVREDSETVLSLHDLDEQVIAVSNPKRLAPLIHAQAPQAKVVSAPNVSRGLELVDQHEADAYVGNLAVVDRLLSKRFFGILKVAAPAGTKDHFVFAARARYASEVAAFDRMLQSIPPRKHEAIRNSWLAKEYQSGLQWQTLLKWGAPIFLVIFTGGIVHSLGYYRLRHEVNERRRAEKRLDKITSNLPAVVYQFRCNMDGSFDFPFIVGDLYSLFGLSIQQAIRDENALFERVHPEDQDRLLASCERMANELIPIDLSFRVLSINGWRWVHSRGLPYKAEDGTILCSGYWIDVTQHYEQAEALSAAKATAERANAAKAEFLATMSHEIRTPMTGVLGMLERLSYTDLNAEQKQTLTSINQSAHMLRQILDDILNISKLEAGALTLEQVPTSLHQTVNSVNQLLVSQAMDKGLNLESYIGEGVAEAHYVDGVRLRQVLFNLISNAIKFTEYGKVQVDLDVVEEYSDQQRIRIVITDTGIGISLEDQQHLFTPFSQAEASTSRRYGGTGLGLSICKQLITLMQSELRMHSCPGEGTRVEFDLDLPISKLSHVKELPDISIMQPPEHASPFWHGCRVLVVEDHPINQDLIRWQMRKLDLECDLVADGETALKAVQDFHYNLMITDCRMPGMDGYALARAVRQHESETGASRLPIIAFTASAMPDEVERCHKAGMDDVMAKPVSLNIMRNTITQWLPTEAGYSRIMLIESGAGISPHIREILKNIGASLDIVGGAEGALDKLAKEKYSIIILSFQEMSESFVVANRLRTEEYERGSGHTPIIGVADKRDADSFSEYLENGIDGIIEQPINDEKLLSMLCMWGFKEISKKDSSKNSGDAGILSQDIISLYKKVVIADLVNLARAVQDDDNDMLIHFAHRLKGAASQDGNGDLEKWASEIEYSRATGRGVYMEIIRFISDVIDR